MASGLVTAVAWQVVGAADDQVSDGPMTPVIAGDDIRVRCQWEDGKLIADIDD